MSRLKVKIKWVYLCKIPLFNAKLRAVSTSASGIAHTNKTAFEAAREEAVANVSARLTLVLLKKTKVVTAFAKTFASYQLAALTVMIKWRLMLGRMKNAHTLNVFSLLVSSYQDYFWFIRRLRNEFYKFTTNII